MFKVRVTRYFFTRSMKLLVREKDLSKKKVKDKTLILVLFFFKVYVQ